MGPMIPWEYKIQYLPNYAASEGVVLTTLGAEGWELKAIVASSDGALLTYYFGRQILADTPV